MPKISGIEFLNKISNFNIEVFIISGEIDYINQINYEYFDKIRKVYIKPFYISNLNDDLKNIYCESNNMKLRNIIDEELSIFNFNKGSSGYEYLIECIEKSILEPRILRNMEKELFPYISNKLNIDNPRTVKWDLQKLLDSMTRYTDNKILLSYFPYTKHPTLKVFITTIDNNIIKKSKSA